VLKKLNVKYLKIEGVYERRNVISQQKQITHRESEVARVFTAAHRDCHIRKIFFYFGPFINNILHLNLIKFYFQIWQFSIARIALAWFLIVTPKPLTRLTPCRHQMSHQSGRSRHIFRTQNEPHYFDWRGFSMSPPPLWTWLILG
jgi:hypothetical protein